uniref:Uncharacterized protein n=1 Tax=Sphingomonas sp. NS2 TaxID=908605 RepID=A0A0D4ZYX1_9SPHN|nr:hypothetical protein plasmid201_042 [Sphingomonas sp. NS2]
MLLLAALWVVQPVPCGAGAQAMVDRTPANLNIGRLRSRDVL